MKQKLSGVFKLLERWQKVALISTIVRIPYLFPITRYRRHSVLRKYVRHLKSNGEYIDCTTEWNLKIKVYTILHYFKQMYKIVRNIYL